MKADRLPSRHVGCRPAACEGRAALRSGRNVEGTGRRRNIAMSSNVARRLWFRAGRPSIVRLAGWIWPVHCISFAIAAMIAAYEGKGDDPTAKLPAHDSRDAGGGCRAAAGAVTGLAVASGQGRCAVGGWRQLGYPGA